MIKDLPTMEVSVGTSQPKPNPAQSPDLIAIIREAMDRKGMTEHELKPWI